MNFSYQYSDFHQLLQHIRKSSPASISVSRKYHLDKGNIDVVSRIDAARLAARIDRLTRKQQTQL
jgi:hypothetical protein